MIILKQTNKPHVRSELFDNLSSRELNYFIGLLASDGNIYNTRIELCLHEKDKDILIKYQQFLENNTTLRIRTKSLTSNQFRIAFRNKRIAETLNTYGITPNKSRTLELNIPITFDLLRGIIDGDGCFMLHQRRGGICHIASASKKFINQIKDFLFNNDINSNLHIAQDKYYNLIIGKRSDLLKLIANLYHNTNLYFLRKKEIAEKILSYKKKENFKCKSIIQYDLLGRKVEEFNSINEASIKARTTRKSIKMVLNNKWLQCNGYIWKFSNDTNFKIPDFAEIKKNRSEKLRERYKGENNPFFGKKHSKETKDKISKTKMKMKK